MLIGRRHRRGSVTDALASIRVIAFGVFLDHHAMFDHTINTSNRRVSSLTRSRARDAKQLERDRILNPEKYKRVHRYMRGMYGN